jgi:hypothetical protein
VVFSNLLQPPALGLASRTLADKRHQLPKDYVKIGREGKETKQKDGKWITNGEREKKKKQI